MVSGWRNRSAGRRKRWCSSTTTCTKGGGQGRAAGDAGEVGTALDSSEA